MYFVISFVVSSVSSLVISLLISFVRSLVLSLGIQFVIYFGCSLCVSYVGISFFMYFFIGLVHYCVMHVCLALGRYVVMGFFSYLVTA